MKNKMDLIAMKEKAARIIAISVGVLGTLSSIVTFYKEAPTYKVPVFLVCGMILIATLVYLIVFMVNLQKLKLFDEANKLGVIGIYESNEAHTLIMDKFIKNEIPIETMKAIVFGGSGLRALLDKDDFRKTFIVNNTKIQILSAHPDADFTKNIACLENEKSRIKTGIINIFECIEKVNEAKGVKNIAEGKFSKAPILNAMILINGEWGFLTLSLPPTLGTNTMSIEFEMNNKKPLLADALLHFDTMWENSSGFCKDNLHELYNTAPKENTQNLTSTPSTVDGCAKKGATK
jgi:hypothetical protein